MSKQYPGGLITKTPVTPSGPYQTSTASGVWTLAEQAYWTKLGQWPTAGNVPVAPTSVNFLLVAGGGGSGDTGAYPPDGGGGGAGAGGVLVYNSYTPASSFTITIGAGGAARTNGTSTTFVAGATTWTAVGGGKGTQNSTAATGDGVGLAAAPGDSNRKKVCV